MNELLGRQSPDSRAQYMAAGYPLLPGLPEDLEVRSSHPSGMSEDIAASRVDGDGSNFEV